MKINYIWGFSLIIAGLALSQINSYLGLGVFTIGLFGLYANHREVTKLKRKAPRAKVGILKLVKDNDGFAMPAIKRHLSVSMQNWEIKAIVQQLRKAKLIETTGHSSSSADEAGQLTITEEGREFLDLHIVKQ